MNLSGDDHTMGSAAAGFSRAAHALWPCFSATASRLASSPPCPFPPQRRHRPMASSIPAATEISSYGQIKTSISLAQLVEKSNQSLSKKVRREKAKQQTNCSLFYTRVGWGHRRRRDRGPFENRPPRAEPALERPATGGEEVGS
jgi:hypothetical protein